MTFYYSMSNPYPQILNLKGSGLNDGYIYIGVAGQYAPDHPQQVYWDADGLVPAEQPIRTTGGYITRPSYGPATLYIADTYSIVVQDKNEVEIYYAPEILDPVFALAQEVAALQAELDAEIAALAEGGGSSLVGFIQGGLGAEATTVQDKLREDISVMDFGAINDGTLHTVQEWIIPGALGRFANLTALQVEYPHVSATTNSIDWAAIQAAINYAIYNGASSQATGAKRKVRMPGGLGYVTTDTIQMGYGTSFNSVVLEGDGYHYRSDTAFNGTAVICTFNDRPGVNFQGGRGSVLRGIGIKGLNYAYLAATLTDTNDTTAATWTNPVFPASADSRYAPYAGITVDAYSGTAPATAYPTVTYPSYLGAVSQYNKAFSSDCLIEDVFIQGFVAGVVNQPCDADGNGDFTQLRRVHIEYCKYGVSVGNTQSRNVGLDHVKMLVLYKGLVNNVHGRQNGKFQGAIVNLSCGKIIHLLDFGSLAGAGPIEFVNFYGEELWRLGDLQVAGSNENALLFKASQFNFAYQTDTRGVPASVLGALTTTPLYVKFEGCQFTNYPSVLTFGPTKVLMDGCALSPSTRQASAAAAYIALAHNATCGGYVAHDLAAQPTLAGIKYNRISPTTLNVDATQYAGTEFATSGRGNSIPVGTTFIYPMNDNKLLQPYSCRIGSLAKSGASVSLTNKTLTFTYGGRSDNAFLLFGPDNGDIIYDEQTGTVFFVRSRTGTSVTAEMQNNYKSSGGGYTPVTSFSTGTGAFYFVSSRNYGTSTYIQGDFSSVSPDITNVGDAIGNASFDAEIAVGDALGVYDTSNYLVAQIDRPIIARDQATQIITLDGNAAKSVTEETLPFFVRQPPANV